MTERVQFPGTRERERLPTLQADWGPNTHTHLEVVEDLVPIVVVVVALLPMVIGMVTRRWCVRRTLAATGCLSALHIGARPANNQWKP